MVEGLPKCPCPGVVPVTVFQIGGWLTWRDLGGSCQAGTSLNTLSPEHPIYQVTSGDCTLYPLLERKKTKYNPAAPAPAPSLVKLRLSYHFVIPSSQGGCQNI